MASRARARSIAILNWKGCFYERFELDPEVTSLEGNNGAGKTTVMIAVYTVLLPELRLLKFRNVGEGSADHDRGIASRLGETGPAYAVLELECGKGERLLAGVHFERTSDTRAILSPFVIEGIDWDVGLAEVLLTRSDVDVIPERVALRQQVLRLGGRYIECTPDEYFRQLFDRGVLPLRMATFEERSRFNLMLQTSMFGGMSGALQNGLRDFLLREDRQLGDTVQKMKRILGECRQSRRVVEANRKLHTSIDGIFRAAWTMFCAGFHSTRSRAAELEQKYRELQGKADALAIDAGAKATAYDDAKKARDAAVKRRDALGVNLKAAEIVLDQTRLAQDLDGRLAIARPLLAKAAAAALLAQEQFDIREKELGRTEKAKDGLDRDLRDVSGKLADLEKAYEEIAGQVGQYRAAIAARDHASKVLAEPVGAAAVQGLIVRFDAERAEVAAKRDVTKDRLDTEAQRAVRFGRILGALERLAGEAVRPEVAAELAGAELNRLRELQFVADRAASLPAQIADAREKALQQAAFLHELVRLTEGAPVPSSVADVQAAADDAGFASEQARVKVDGLKTAVAELKRAAEELRLKAEAANARIEPWRRTTAALDVLQRHLGERPGCDADLDGARASCTKSRDVARDGLRKATENAQQLAREAETLRNSGGQVAAELERVRDAVQGTFLAEHMHDVPVEDAAKVEARLGPLAMALMVEDVGEAAGLAAEMADRPDTVWFVRSEAGVPEAEFFGDGALVGTGDAWRLTRLPQHPTVGRAAREREVARLEAASVVERREVARISGELEVVQQALSALDRIDRKEVASTSPELDLERINIAQNVNLGEAKGAKEELERATAESGVLADRRDSWLRLLPRAQFVEPPDHGAEVKRLEEALVLARGAAQRLKDARSDRQVVAEGLDHLLILPLTPSALTELEAAHTGLAGEVQRFLGLLAALRAFHEVAHALAWEHLIDVLKQRRTANDALRERQTKLEGDLTTATAALGRARAAREVASTLSGTEMVAEAGARQTVDTLAESRASVAIEDGSTSAVERAESLVERLKTEHTDADGQVQGSMETAGRAEAEWERAESDHEAAKTTAADAKQEWAPWQEQWAELLARAEVAGASASVMAPEVLAAFGDGGAGLARQALAEERTLHARLRAESDGAELLAGVPSSERRGLQHLETWLAVRRWLLERLPMELGETGDLSQGLALFEQRLSSLQKTLLEKEELLKTSARSVSDNLRARIRQEIYQVHKLNDQLRSVGFGSIRGIELVADRVSSMDQLLERLRDPDQQDLFRRDTPIEEALAQLFEEVGGGKIKGDRLLDYREYLHVRVRVARAPSGAWEPASSRMSTGEAIGVGAAILVVVLTAWEKDATILRTEQRSGTLRFLFLDEANRLSPNSLNVLFDLCSRLELQLLIAAPDIARVARGTTYHLTRTEDDEGREMVVASGRRLVAGP